MNASYCALKVALGSWLKAVGRFREFQLPCLPKLSDLLHRPARIPAQCNNPYNLRERCITFGIFSREALSFPTQNLAREWPGSGTGSILEFREADQ